MHSDWSKAFLTITPVPYLPSYVVFCRKLEDPYYFHIEVKKVQMNRQSFLKAIETQFLTFCPHLIHQIVFKKMGLVSFLIHNSLTSKNWWATFDILHCQQTNGQTDTQTNEQTDKQMHEQSQIHSTFLLALVSNVSFTRNFNNIFLMWPIILIYLLPTVK